MENLPTGAKRILLVFFDVVVLGLSILAAFWLRLGWPFDTRYAEFLAIYFVPFILVKVVIFYGFGMYRRLWRYASIQELRVVLQAVAASSLIVLFFSYSLGTLPIPRTVLIVDGLLTLITVGGIRLLGRTVSELKMSFRTPPGARRILIVGAGDAGAMLAKEMLKNSERGFFPVGFIDDDPNKKSMKVHGIKVLGSRKDIKTIIGGVNIDEVIIAMPSIDRQVKEEVVNVCKQSGVRCRTLPGIYEIIDGRVGIGQIRDVQIEDILGRDPVTVDLDEISQFIVDSVVMITGAGGSIGSELCRQISYFNPSLLIVVDIAENSLFEIEQELLAKHRCQIMAVVADVKNEARIDELIQAHPPRVIFHAAAYKHVPLMEMNPKVALENNFIGTSIMAEAAVRHGVEKFILISTDKAVNPINVMGISKALAEKVVLSIHPNGTRFIVVRFGNVLASQGSVVPIFQKQIAAGGPITITHPDMKRYLMTITESVQLVLQAAAFGGAGEVFLLDMGAQVSIVELAKKLVELSGFTNDQISIEYIGVRPGEKIEEELIAPTEKLLSSPHPKIGRLDNSDQAVSGTDLRELEELIRTGQMSAVFAKSNSLILSTEEAGRLSAGQKVT